MDARYKNRSIKFQSSENSRAVRAINHADKRRNRRGDDLLSRRNISPEQEDTMEYQLQEGQSGEDFIKMIQNKTLNKLEKEKTLEEKGRERYQQMLIWKKNRSRQLEIEKKKRSKPFYVGGFCPDTPKYLHSDDIEINNKAKSKFSTPSKKYLGDGKTPSTASKLPWNYGVGSAVKANQSAQKAVAKCCSTRKIKDATPSLHQNKPRPGRQIKFTDATNTTTPSVSLRSNKSLLFSQSQKDNGQSVSMTKGHMGSIIKSKNSRKSTRSLKLRSRNLREDLGITKLQDSPVQTINKHIDNEEQEISEYNSKDILIPVENNDRINNITHENSSIGEEIRENKNVADYSVENEAIVDNPQDIVNSPIENEVVANIPDNSVENVSIVHNTEENEATPKTLVDEVQKQVGQELEAMDQETPNDNTTKKVLINEIMSESEIHETTVSNTSQAVMETKNLNESQVKDKIHNGNINPIVNEENEKDTESVKDTDASTKHQTQESSFAPNDYQFEAPVGLQYHSFSSNKNSNESDNNAKAQKPQIITPKLNVEEPSTPSKRITRSSMQLSTPLSCCLRPRTPCSRSTRRSILAHCDDLCLDSLVKTPKTKTPRRSRRISTKPLLEDADTALSYQIPVEENEPQLENPINQDVEKSDSKKKNKRKSVINGGILSPLNDQIKTPASCERRITRVSFKKIESSPWITAERGSSRKKNRKSIPTVASLLATFDGSPLNTIPRQSEDTPKPGDLSQYLIPTDSPSIESPVFNVWGETEETNTLTNDSKRKSQRMALGEMTPQEVQNINNTPNSNNKSVMFAVDEKQDLNISTKFPATPIGLSTRLSMNLLGANRSINKENAIEMSEKENNTNDVYNKTPSSANKKLNRRTSNRRSVAFNLAEDNFNTSVKFPSTPIHPSTRLSMDILSKDTNAIDDYVSNYENIEPIRKTPVGRRKSNRISLLPGLSNSPIPERTEPYNDPVVANLISIDTPELPTKTARRKSKVLTTPARRSRRISKVAIME